MNTFVFQFHDLILSYSTLAVDRQDELLQPVKQAPHLRYTKLNLNASTCALNDFLFRSRYITLSPTTNISLTFLFSRLTVNMSRADELHVAHSLIFLFSKFTVSCHELTSFTLVEQRSLNTHICILVSVSFNLNLSVLSVTCFFSVTVMFLFVFVANQI